VNLIPCLADRLAYHRQHPDVSIDAYARLRALEVGERVMAGVRIYLDKCFWIHLRDAALTSPSAASELLILLREAAASGRLCCPISEATFLELMKQSDLATRHATAALIDELSHGVSLAPSEQRSATEVAHLLHWGVGDNVQPLEHLVWTKVAYVLGVQHPVSRALPVTEQMVLQKAFFDHLWDVPLVELIAHLDTSYAESRTFAKTAEKLNRLNSEHARGVRSFAQVHREEINGVLELAVPVGVQVLHEMARRAQIAPPPTAVEEEARMILGLLRGAAQTPLGRQTLRTWCIGAALHAATRWNRSQKLVANELFDFQHAKGALAYCDAFFTDKPMHTLLAQKHHGLLQEYPCHVASTMSDALTVARTVLNEDRRAGGQI
jgi:hypothetical protein